MKKKNHNAVHISKTQTAIRIYSLNRNLRDCRVFGLGWLTTHFLLRVYDWYIFGFRDKIRTHQEKALYSLKVDEQQHISRRNITEWYSLNTRITTMRVIIVIMHRACLKATDNNTQSETSFAGHHGKLKNIDGTLIQCKSQQRTFESLGWNDPLVKLKNVEWTDCPKKSRKKTNAQSHSQITMPDRA